MSSTLMGKSEWINKNCERDWNFFSCSHNPHKNIKGMQLCVDLNISDTSLWKNFSFEIECINYINIQILMRALMICQKRISEYLTFAPCHHHLSQNSLISKATKIVSLWIWRRVFDLHCIITWPYSIVVIILVSIDT